MFGLTNRLSNSDQANNTNHHYHHHHYYWKRRHSIRIHAYQRCHLAENVHKSPGLVGVKDLRAQLKIRESIINTNFVTSRSSLVVIDMINITGSGPKTCGPTGLTSENVHVPNSKSGSVWLWVCSNFTFVTAASAAAATAQDTID